MTFLFLQRACMRKVKWGSEIFVRLHKPILPFFSYYHNPLLIIASSALIFMTSEPTPCLDESFAFSLR